MGNAFGSSSLKAEISLPSFVKFLQQVKEAGNDVDELCEEAVNATLPIVEGSMKKGAARHKKSGAVLNAIETTPAKKEGNYIWGGVGIDMDKHPEAKHAVYQEYGDGHSPEFPDPFVRPAVKNNKAAIRKAEREVLKRGGVPIE